MSKTYSEIHKETVEKVRNYCERKLKQLDGFADSGIANETDFAMSYAYRVILEIIKESEG